jgi:hypothetical protein
MATILIRNAAVLGTMDEGRRELAGCAVVVQDGVIAADQGDRRRRPSLGSA